MENIITFSDNSPETVPCHAFQRTKYCCCVNFNFQKRKGSHLEPGPLRETHRTRMFVIEYLIVCVFFKNSILAYLFFKEKQVAVL